MARAEIFTIHLAERGLKPAAFDMAALAAASDGFSGAEIEQAIVSALYLANAEEAVLNRGHIERALRETRPLSVLMAEQVAALRAWGASATFRPVSIAWRRLNHAEHDGKDQQSGRASTDG